MFGFAGRAMPSVLRGVRTFSMSSAGMRPPASTDMPSWRRLVNDVLEDAHVDKTVQTRVQFVLEHPAEALQRADKEIARADKEIARADAEIARADAEIARADAEIARVIVAKDEVIGAKNAELARVDKELARVIGAKSKELARADKALVKTEEVFSMQLKSMHDSLWMIHAVYMPRILGATLLCAIEPNSESQSIGSKEFRAFVDANVYEPGKGLGVQAGKRVFKPDALEALGSWSHSDVLSVHKAIEDLFKVWSTPHHVIVRNAQGSGSVIGANGEPVTTAEVIFFSVGMKQLERLRPDVRWPAPLEVVRIITGKTAVGGIDFDSRTLGRSTTQTPAGGLCTTREQAGGKPATSLSER